MDPVSRIYVTEQIRMLKSPQQMFPRCLLLESREKNATKIKLKSTMKSHMLKTRPILALSYITLKACECVWHPTSVLTTQSLRVESSVFYIIPFPLFTELASCAFITTFDPHYVWQFCSIQSPQTPNCQIQSRCSWSKYRVGFPQTSGHSIFVKWSVHNLVSLHCMYFIVCMCVPI